MKRIGLISDTHSYLDDSIVRSLNSCDEIWHAGDIGSVEVADTLASLKPFRAVYGNIDGGVMRRMFPLNDVFECEGLKVWMTHIGGYPGKYPSRIAQGIIEHRPGLFICGHSHILKVMPDKVNKLLHMNPGAAGQHGFHLFRTILRFSIANGIISNVEAVELGRRGKILD
jgi:putative phosphoesterase